MSISSPQTGQHTPLMRQYWEIKNNHLDKILLFRMGDFYEMFFDDAIKVAPILDIALTSRNKSQGQDVPMCGMPHHSVGPQVNKLLKAGLKVAICDQLENPEAMEGKIMKRGVTRVVTPGLVYDPDQLDAKTSHNVMALLQKAQGFCDIAVVDASTGEMKSAKNISAAQVLLWTQRLSPRELILPDLAKLFFDPQTLLTERPWISGQSIENYLSAYVSETQGDEILKTLGSVEILSNEGLQISETTIKHLEIFKSYENQNDGTLFSAIDHTCTPMGARLLKERLAQPYFDLEIIKTEQDLTKNLSDYLGLREKLSRIGDLDRKIVKLSNPLCNGRDLQALGHSLKVCLEIKEALGALGDSFFKKTEVFKLVESVSEKIVGTLRDELPVSVREGSLIRPGLNPQLDEFVDLSTHAQTKLSDLENREKGASGIQSLKIKYNNIFGYSFEITKSNLDKVPSHFIRRQTLAQAERFVTQELSDLEQKILSAQQKRTELEFSIFNQLRKEVLEKALDLLSISKQVAHLDLILSFVKLKIERDFTHPEFVDSGINITKSRHPVLELSTTFIPNDIVLPAGSCILLTGPNMAGKSTLMRQVALTVLLAQIGAPVPASSAQLPLFDHIFTRIGASDNLSKGLSTFMVEMTETAQIIRDATTRSLIILDEIGRGTSTYDGLSLAQAVLEHFVEKVKGYVFFATHYHELTELSSEYQNIFNAHMSIEEHKDGLIFLRKLTDGPANRSYGIEVAKLAGMPGSVVTKASRILRDLTKKSHKISQGEKLAGGQLDLLDQVFVQLEAPVEAPLQSDHSEKLEVLTHKIKSLDLNQTTPLAALQFLSELSNSLGDHDIHS